MEFLGYIASVGVAFIAAGVLIKRFMKPADSDGIVPACFASGAMLIYVSILVLGASAVFARDDGRYAGSALHDWFEQLRSGKGPCCSDADGMSISDPDWSMDGGRYRVRIGGEWRDVPEDAVITEPNRAGRAMVWPMWSQQSGGPMQFLGIRCFMPGQQS